MSNFSSEFFEGRQVLRLVSRVNGTVENASDYEPKNEDDVSTPGRWDLLLSFAQAHPSLFDIEFADLPANVNADKKGNYSRTQLDKMSIPKLNELLASYNLSGMPNRSAAIGALLDAQAAKS